MLALSKGDSKGATWAIARNDRPTSGETCRLRLLHRGGFDVVAGWCGRELSYK